MRQELQQSVRGTAGPSRELHRTAAEIAKKHELRRNCEPNRRFCRKRGCRRFCREITAFFAICTAKPAFRHFCDVVPISGCLLQSVQILFEEQYILPFGTYTGFMFSMFNPRFIFCAVTFVKCSCGSFDKNKRIGNRFCRFCIAIFFKRNC